jgi:hypothetical protein
MRRSLYIALAFSALVYSGSIASAEPCTIGLHVNKGAWILYKHKKLTQCVGAMGCKCVSCYNLDKSVSATCFALAVK